MDYKNPNQSKQKPQPDILNKLKIFEYLDCLPWPGLKVGWRELLDESEPLLNPWFSCAMSALATLPSSNMDMAGTKHNYRDCYRTITQNGCSHLLTGIQYRWYITTNTGLIAFESVLQIFLSTSLQQEWNRKLCGKDKGDIQSVNITNKLILHCY